MKFVAKKSFSKETVEVSYAYFDLNNILCILDNELLVKVVIKNNELQIDISTIVKKVLMCYYIDIDRLKLAAIKFILKHRTGLIPPDFKDSSFDEVILRK
jgi:hypothetical protein